MKLSPNLFKPTPKTFYTVFGLGIYGELSEDIKEWILWKLKDESLEEFRKENPDFVKKYRKKFHLK